MNKTHLVKILIPVYKSAFSDNEMRSLKQVYHVLSDFPMLIVKPESLDVSSLLADFPALTTCSFPDAYFDGIAGYNRLMLSEQFYARFPDTEYLLIYQLDAYVFRNELAEWCAKGYDYIGAPWLKKPVYDFPLLSTFMKWCLWYDRHRGRFNKQQLYNRTGNGGFSLRKVESHFRATQLYSRQIAYFLAQKRSHLFNEDVFWATVPDFFSYPDVTEALRFAFDKYPRYCYRLNHRTLPFGCHAWSKRKMKRFWAPIIRFIKTDS
jgi:hypothetical protein